MVGGLGRMSVEKMVSSIEALAKRKDHHLDYGVNLYPLGTLEPELGPEPQLRELKLGC